MSFSISTLEFSSFEQIMFLCFLICLFFFGNAVWERSFSKLPPGPWGLPVVGKSLNVFHVSK